MKKTNFFLFTMLLLSSCSISFGDMSSSGSSSQKDSSSEVPSTSVAPSTSSFLEPSSSSTFVSPSFSTTTSSSSAVKLLDIAWEKEPVVSSYYGEELAFSSYGSILATYTNQEKEVIALKEENMKTSRVNLFSLLPQTLYIRYEDFSLPFTICLTKKLSTSSVEFVQKMGVGWNLGNSFSAFLDGFDYKNNSAIVKELGFDVDQIEMFCEVRDQPSSYRGKITPSMIQAVYEKGFRSIRIPIAFSNHMEEDGTIHSIWLDRIQEVVNYIYEDYEDLYVVLVLMDGLKGYELSSIGYEKSLFLVEKVWKQMATRFASYDERVIFENLNEPLYNQDTRWNLSPTQHQTLYKEANENLMKLNQAFVDEVRKVGGQNENRYLMVSTYGDIPEYTYDSEIQKVSTFSLPKDSIKDKLLLNAHAYYPNKFCYHNDDSSYYTNSWSESNSNDTYQLKQVMDALETNFIKKGVGVVISEWGSVDKNFEGRDASRERHAYFYLKEATKRGIATMVWDNGAVNGDDHVEAFGFLNKHKASGLYDNMKKLSYVNYQNDILWYHENILAQIFLGYEEGQPK